MTSRTVGERDRDDRNGSGTSGRYEAIPGGLVHALDHLLRHPPATTRKLNEQELSSGLAYLDLGAVVQEQDLLGVLTGTAQRVHLGDDDDGGTLSHFAGPHLLGDESVRRHDGAGRRHDRER